MDPFVIEIYESDTGKLPYLEWENSLSIQERAIVTTRLARIRRGNMGDCKLMKGGEGIHEIRIHFGPGYRIYYGIKDSKILLLLCGGNKSTQTKDVQKAKMFWQNYLQAQREVKL